MRFGCSHGTARRQERECWRTRKRPIGAWLQSYVDKMSLRS